MKKGIKILAFLAIFFICGNYIYGVLLWKNSTDNNLYNIQHFYELEDESIDALFMGSSHCFCTINNAVLWENYGIASYNLATGCQNIGNTYYFFKEALKTQSPKVAIIEMYYTSVAGYGTGDIYRNTLGLHLSKEYAENVKYSLSMENKGIEYYDMLLKWPVIHTRYSELTKADFVDPYPNSLGYYSSWISDYELITPEACFETRIGTIHEDVLFYLDKIVELAADNEVQLIFFVAPYMLTPEQQQIYNALEIYAEKKDIVFYNFNSIYEDVDFDYSKDMWEDAHLNSWGAEKITKYLGKMLMSNYEFADRRGDEKYRKWQINLEEWKVEKSFHSVYE